MAGEDVVLGSGGGGLLVLPLPFVLGPGLLSDGKDAAGLGEALVLAAALTSSLGFAYTGG